MTLRLREELGEFQTVRFVKSYSRWAGTGYRNYVYVVDEKWQVTVVGNCYSGGEFYDSYQVEDYTKIVASQKAYGRRVAAIEMMLGDTWHKLSCSGQKQTTTLADYLLGE